MVPHTANTPSSPPPHVPPPPTAPAAQGNARAPTATGPTRSTPPPPAAPPPAPDASKHHPPAATHCLRTAAPPGCPDSRLSPVPRDHSQPGTARTTRHAHANTHTTRPDTQTFLQHSTHPRPPRHEQCRPHIIPCAAPPRNQATDAPRGDLYQPLPPPAPADTQHREYPLPRATRDPLSPEPTRDNDDPPPKPTQTLPSHPARTTAAPAEPYAIHNPTGVRQYLRGLRNQEVLRLYTSGTTQHIWEATLVQAATLGEGVRDFLFDAFLQVAKHDRPHAPALTGEPALHGKPNLGSRDGAGGHQGPHPLP